MYFLLAMLKLFSHYHEKVRIRCQKKVRKWCQVPCSSQASQPILIFLYTEFWSKHADEKRNLLADFRKETEFIRRWECCISFFLPAIFQVGKQKGWSLLNKQNLSALSENQKNDSIKTTTKIQSLWFHYLSILFFFPITQIPRYLCLFFVLFLQFYNKRKEERRKMCCL